LCYRLSLLDDAVGARQYALTAGEELHRHFQPAAGLGSTQRGGPIMSYRTIKWTALVRVRAEPSRFDERVPHYVCRLGHVSESTQELAAALRHDAGLRN
jgi:hypothetical protein